MATNWSAEAADIKKDIIDEGVVGEIYIETPGEYDVTTGKKISTVLDADRHDVACLIRNIDQPDHDNILPTDIEVMACPIDDDPGFGDMKNMKLSLNTKTYYVLNTKSIMPAGIVLFYIFHCRS